MEDADRLDRLCAATGGGDTLTDADGATRCRAGARRMSVGMRCACLQNARRASGVAFTQHHRVKRICLALNWFAMHPVHGRYDRWPLPQRNPAC